MRVVDIVLHTFNSFSTLLLLVTSRILKVDQNIDNNKLLLFSLFFFLRVYGCFLTTRKFVFKSKA